MRRIFFFEKVFFFGIPYLTLATDLEYTTYTQHAYVKFSFNFGVFSVSFILSRFVFYAFFLLRSPLLLLLFAVRCCCWVSI